MPHQLLNRRSLPVLLLGSALLIAMALYLLRPQPVVVANAEKRWHVEVTAVEPSAIAPTLPLYGFIESPGVASISSAVDADVVEVPALDGASVLAGELLVALDPTDLELVVTQREAELAETTSEIEQEQQRFRRDKLALEEEQKLLQLARRGADRANRLAKQKLGSQAGVDDAERALAQQQLAVNSRELSLESHPARLARLQAEAKRRSALLAQARIDLGRTRLAAPFPGRIAKVTVSVGDRVRVGTVLVAVYDTSRLELRAQIPGHHVSVVAEALKNGLELPAWGRVNGRRIEFVLDRLAGEVIRESGGASAIFRLQGRDEELPLGRFVDIHLTLPAVANTVALPFDALYGNNLIYRIADSRLQSLAVSRIGITTDDANRDLVLLRSTDLRSGDQVLLTQLPNAVDGLLVEIATTPRNAR